jgi:hypothetical protein
MRLRLTHLAAVVAMAVSIIIAPARATAQVAGTPLTAKPDTASQRVHVRVLGVFDEQTGEVIEGADVTDAATGITARTTVTGTVALIFADTNGTLIRIKKVGYQPVSMLIGTALRDTSPITATILRAGVNLPTVITIGNRVIKLGSADTNSTLLRNGFYERREISAAPRSAFIDGSKLRGTSVLSNARFFGRAICESNVWIDGMKVTVPRRTGHFLKEGIDAILNPFDVAGIETYTTGEMPAGTTHTIDAPGSLDPSAGPGTGTVGTGASGGFATNAAGTLASSGCVTMIWLNR